MLYLSSACIKNDNILKAIDEIGVITSNIELSGGSRIRDGLLKELKAAKENYGLNFLVHSYFPPPEVDFVLNFADISNKTRAFIDESMRYVEYFNIPYYSIHAGFKKDFSIKDELLINGENGFLIDNIGDNISWFYSKYTQKLALENLFPNNQAETCFASHIDEIIEILDLDERVFLLLDLGHLKIASKFYGFDYLKAVNLLFDNYSERILEIHLSENNGFEDNHHIILSDSVQCMILEKFRNNIVDNKINVVIEARGYTVNELKDCYTLLNTIIGEGK